MSEFFDFDLAAAYEELGDELTPPILKTGEYEVEVIAANTGRTQKGDPKWGLQLEVISGPSAGHRLWDNLNWITTKNDGSPNVFGLKMTQQALAHMGATPDWVRQTRAGVDDIAEQITGARVLIYVTEDEWRGDPVNRVKYKRGLGHAGAAAAAAPSIGQAQPQQQQQQQQGQAPSNNGFPTL